MKQNQRFVFKQVAAAGMFLAVLALNFVPVSMLALDRQVLPENTSARSDWTHVMNIKYTDVTNGVIYSQWRLYPGSGSFSKGDVIDKVAVYVETPFAVPNANAGSNSVFLNAGRADVTNSFVSNYEIGSNATQFVLYTNVPPLISSAGTNNTVVSLTFSNSAAPATLVAGEAHIFIRVTPFNRLKDY